MADFIRGFLSLFQGFALLRHKGIRPFVVVPFLINVVIFSLAVWILYEQFEMLMGHFTFVLPGWLSWLSWLTYLFTFLFTGLVLIAVYYSFTIIANLVAAPFNSLLAERIEQKLEGLPVPEFQGFKSIPSLVGRTVASEMKKIAYMLKWLVLLLIITFIPGLNIIAPFAWALYGAWMLAIQYFDYPMGNHELFFKEELVVIKSHRMLALGMGAGLALMMMIPVLNFFTMPVGVAASTVLWVRQVSKMRTAQSFLRAP